ncbi:MAG: transglycosylase SLT domain-containing protein [bacterium]
MTRLAALIAHDIAGATRARNEAGASGAMSEADARRLKDAADALEALFVTQLVKASRMVSAGLSGEQAGGSVYQGLAEESFGDALAKSADFGIATDLVRSLQKQQSRAHVPNVAAAESIPAPTSVEVCAAPVIAARPVTSKPSVSIPVLPPVADRVSPVIEETAPVAAAAPDALTVTPIAPAADGAPRRAATAKAERFAARLAAFAEPVMEAAERFGVDPRVIEAVIAKESSGNPRAVSPKGAQGLMQIIPETARELGLSNPFNPRENILAGTRYLARMLDRFGGDLPLALAAYNAGPGAVSRHGGIPPYRETIRYVSEVLSLVGDLKSASRNAAMKGLAGTLKEAAK